MAENQREYRAQIRIVDLARGIHAEMIEISMLWQQPRSHDDPGLLWLRALFLFYFREAPQS